MALTCNLRSNNKPVEKGDGCPHSGLPISVAPPVFFADIAPIGVALGLYRLQDIFKWEFVKRSSLNRAIEPEIHNPDIAWLTNDIDAVSIREQNIRIAETAGVGLKEPCPS